MVLVGSLTLPTYHPNYDDRIYVADDSPSKLGYAASDRHFRVSRLNGDMLMVESDHDMRNSTEMIALDRVARSVFHTPGVGMIQSVTKPLGTPLEYSSFTYTMGSMGTKIKEILPLLTDLKHATHRNGRHHRTHNGLDTPSTGTDVSVRPARLTSPPKRPRG